MVEMCQQLQRTIKQMESERATYEEYVKHDMSIQQNTIAKLRQDNKEFREMLKVDKITGKSALVKQREAQKEASQIVELQKQYEKVRTLLDKERNKNTELQARFDQLHSNFENKMKQLAQLRHSQQQQLHAFFTSLITSM